MNLIDRISRLKKMLGKQPPKVISYAELPVLLADVSPIYIESWGRHAQPHEVISALRIAHAIGKMTGRPASDFGDNVVEIVQNTLNGLTTFNEIAAKAGWKAEEAAIAMQQIRKIQCPL